MSAAADAFSFSYSSQRLQRLAFCTDASFSRAGSSRQSETGHNRSLAMTLRGWTTTPTPPECDGVVYVLLMAKAKGQQAAVEAAELPLSTVPQPLRSPFRLDARIPASQPRYSGCACIRPEGICRRTNRVTSVCVRDCSSEG